MEVGCCKNRTFKGMLLIYGLVVVVVFLSYHLGNAPTLHILHTTLGFNKAMTSSNKSRVVSDDDKPNRSFVILKSNTTPYFYKSMTRHPNDRFKKETSYQLSELKTILQKSETSVKKIAYYNPPFWWEPWWCEQGIKHCPIASCSCFHGHETIPEADGVIVDAVKLKNPVAPERRKDQIWIFYGLEPPAHYRWFDAYKSEGWRSRFNWTMTYRLDSDIVTPYNVLLRQRVPANKDYARIVSEKTKHGLIFASNCKTESKREPYIEELSKYYPVDVFGKCGKKKIREDFNVSSPEVQRSYRFYLAFENSFCDDYITEKVFKIYERAINLIPIVRGGVDYKKFLPDGTYINTADYKSPKDLAEYLRYLETNESAYIDILRKKDAFVHAGHRSNFISSFCDICIKLHNVETFHNHYPDISNWIHQGTCSHSKVTDLGNIN